MDKKNKNFIWTLFILIILISGCRPPTSDGSKAYGYRKGTNGLVMNFLSGAPPDKIFADSDKVEIPISIEVRNKGAYPTPDDGTSWNYNSVIFISGFDKGIIKNWKIENNNLDNVPSVNLKGRAVLEGKSINNPEGGYDLLEFVGTADLGGINEKYIPNFLVTACYDYKTIANPNVCIDPRPFTTAKEKKVCTIHDVSLKDQGAPVAITKVEEKALSNSLQFKIHFKNVGRGDVIAINALNRCYGEGRQEKLEKRHMDLVKITKVRIGTKDLNCGKLLTIEGDDNYARLINNEGFVVCNLKDYKE
jgi:hypothetical protein